MATIHFLYTYDYTERTHDPFVHRKSIKKLVLKNLNSSQYSSPLNKETDDLASPSEYPQNGHRSAHRHTHTDRSLIGWCILSLLSFMM